MKDVQSEVKDIQSEMKDMKHGITSIELHLENRTDKCVNLIAENFTDLTDKLNQAIPVANKNLAYEVKVTYLLDEVEKLKKELAELKSKIA